MAVFVGTTVIHRVAVNERRGVGITACGQRFALGDPGYDPNGAFTDGYVDWWNDRNAKGARGRYVCAKLKCRCSHCGDREPVWKRLRRLRRKLLRA